MSEQHPHASIIEDLGGAPEMRRKLASLGYPVAAPAVRHWRRRGIPWRLRAPVKTLLLAEGRPVPAGFLHPQPKDIE